MLGSNRSRHPVFFKKTEQPTIFLAKLYVICYNNVKNAGVCRNGANFTMTQPHSKLVFTQDGIPPEIMLHSDYMNWFLERGVDFLAWGSSGPDFLLKDLGLIGEVKKENTDFLLKAAVKEIYERTRTEFKIGGYSGFFVITGSVIRLYDQVDKSDWKDVDLQDCLVFEHKNRDIFLDCIRNRGGKLNIENHLDYALDFILDERFGLCVSDGLRILFNLNNDARTIVRKRIYFNPDTDNEFCIEIRCEEAARQQLLNFLRIFTVKDINVVKEYIKHNYSSHLPDAKKANLGKYYTPKEIVETVKREISGEIHNDTYVMDLACGCGAFLELFDDCHIIGRDIDAQAIEILDLFNFANVAADNSLFRVSREKYGLRPSDDVIIIGNPPYNDTSSINKRYSTKAKSKREPEDPDIHCRDIGRSFLEAYAKLAPRRMCILHPLAFLTKRVNFQNLKYLQQNYRLVNSVIFKSTVFRDLYGGTPFPIVISTYQRDAQGMDYSYIRDFTFSIYGSEKKFKLSRIGQAGHDYIHQTVTGLDLNHDSDIGLYHYNFRDMNSLNKANFREAEYRASHKDTMLVVNFRDLWKYCYVNCIKKFMLPLLGEDEYYILGNLNPVVDRAQVEDPDPYWRDLFIICSILKNSHRIACMNIENRAHNMLSHRFMINDYKRRSKQLEGTGRFNFYRLFLDYAEHGDEGKKDQIYAFITDYFRTLIKDCFFT